MSKLAPEEIARQRMLIVKAALSWVGTPYEPKAAVKGAGSDCLTLLPSVYGALGMDIDVVPDDLPYYSKDWHLHQTREFYLEGKDGKPGILHFCDEVAGPPDRHPLPGDIVLWKFGLCFSHATIVIAWPIVIHAYIGRPVTRESVATALYLTKIFELKDQKGKPRPRKYFTLKQWAE
jgi:cell wall-associated NlpC family hydrolase